MQRLVSTISSLDLRIEKLIVVTAVMTTVILASATIPITVDNVEKSYPRQITFNILFGLGFVMAMHVSF